MVGFANTADVQKIVAEAAWQERDVPVTMHALLDSVASRFPDNKPRDYYPPEPASPDRLIAMAGGQSTAAATRRPYQVEPRHLSPVSTVKKGLD